ncbi:MAG: aldehyde dehydrogenase family protein, partial [Acidiferrobacterales bacterium]
MDVKVTNLLHHYIGGQKVEGASGRFGDVLNPATGEISARVPFASAEETKQAIQAAAKALPGWAATPPAQRAQVLFRFRDLLRRELDELAALLSAEHGKTLADAKGSVTRGVE